MLSSKSIKVCASAGLISCCLLVTALVGSAVQAAEITISGTPLRPTPRVLAYNMGHFYPGSNAADWWRYSRASGARIFLWLEHIRVSGTSRPGDAEVVDEASFLARRAALRNDPLNTDYINWPIVEGRFDTVLGGNNKIIPSYALGKIHAMGGRILAQMTLGERAFPISSENDWGGKWLAWRTFYTAAFHLARAFDVERFTSHNEPNHSNSFIQPTPWLMRVRLAADAVQCALADVNRIYGKNLQPRFNAPVTAGSTGTSFDSYGRPAVQGICTDFLGQSPPGFQLFQYYAYQRYNLSAGWFVSDFLNLRSSVNSVTPSGIAPLPLALTEYNVHMGATYDTLTASSDTLSKAVTFGGISAGLVNAGMQELFAFKFGMTIYPSTRNFPVQKNGMSFCDNYRRPHNYGTMGRSAEVYRLFNKGFAPGREILSRTTSGTGAANLRVLVSRDPVSYFHYVFSVNESDNDVPMEINVTALGIPEGNHAIIEDVSQWRSGIIRSVEQVADGKIMAGNQPAQSVWLISIPGHPQKAIEGSRLLTVPVSKDVMVRDGIHASVNHGASEEAYARHDDGSAEARSAVFLQFELAEDIELADVQLAILALPVGPRNGGSERIHAHLYGLDSHDWEETGLTWDNAPNLRQNAPLGREIRHRVVEGAGETAHILAQLTASGAYVLRQVDVTDYLRTQTGRKASFLIAQEPRWDRDINVTQLPGSRDDLTTGDLQVDGLGLRTREAAVSTEDAAHLILIRLNPATVTLADLSQIYNGTPREVTYATTPTGLAVHVTYDGSVSAPIDAGTYAVIATVDDPAYAGSTNGTLVIDKATPDVPTWPTSATVPVAQPLSTATIVGGIASVPGTFTFDSPTTVYAEQGVYTAAVSFAANDPANYNPVGGGTVEVTVGPPNQPPEVHTGPNQTVAMSGSTAWTPAHITTAAWYDAADTNTITLANGKVSRWDDKSNNSNHLAQATESKQPAYSVLLNGMQGVKFASSSFQELQNLSFAVDTTQLTFFALYKYNTVSEMRRILSLRRNATTEGLLTLFSYGSPFGDRAGYRYPTNLTVTGDTADTAVRFVSYTTDGTNDQRLYKNGAYVNNRDGGIGSFATQRLYFGSEGGSQYSDSDIYEVVIMEAVSESDRQKIEGYLGHKWGLAANLPVGHPYKAAAQQTPQAIVTLAGAATDADGDPLTTTWSVVGGDPAFVTVADAAATNTTVTFSRAGIYTLRLTAHDGYGESYADVVITVGDVAMTDFQQWLLENGLDPNTSEDDLASNGVSTLREMYIAGLSPTNAQSRFVIDHLEWARGGSVLQWYSVTGRLYRVYWSSNLLSEFELIGSNISWNASTFTDSVARVSEKGFYRIDVQLE